MKAELIIYKILSFLLLPVAAFFAICCLFTLLAAISNPVSLAVTFLYACIVIYIISSFIFLTKGIGTNRTLKTSLRDLVRINGTITFLFCLLAATSLTSFHMEPATAKVMLKQIEEQNSLQIHMSVEQFQAIIQVFTNALFVLSIILIVHVIISLHLLSKYRYLFYPEENNEPEQ